nr:hypothetical protein [Tanacetum cinerariifolium]
MQRKKNNVKARTTLLLSLPDEHQLRFSKFKTAKELWVVILKTFGASKNLDHLIESQRSDQVKKGVGYNDVPTPADDLYLSPKKYLSWTGLPEFVDGTVTDYSRPSPTVESTLAEGSEFVLHKKPCFNCGNFSHLANKCKRRVHRETTRSGGYKPHGGSMRPSYRPTGHRPHDPSINQGDPQ